MKKVLEIGGFVSGAILIFFGVAVIALGANGRSTVNSSLKQEQITGSSDMTPALIKVEATKAGLTNVSLPSCSVAGLAITTGPRARCFAQYMRIHALEASGGLPYSQMPRFATPTARERTTRRPRSRDRMGSRSTTLLATTGSPRPRSRRRSTSASWPTGSRCSAS